MQTINAQQVADRLPYGQLIDALDEAFRDGAIVPDRTQHTIGTGSDHDGTLLLMPAWRPGRNIGVKIATVFPGNADNGLGAVQASYLLLDAVTGLPQALLDGAELTRRRTACASALAARYLAREDARVLLMVGAGKLAPHLIAAHATARPLEQVLIWARREEAAHKLAAAVRPAGHDVRVVTNLEAAVRQADTISCATLATEPLIRGEWLGTGQHLDLVGAFTPEMREADSEALQRARVFVDTYAGALTESGEVIQAIDEGCIDRSDIVADLTELAQGKIAGRHAEDDITLFKSVGTALEDLAAAELVLRNS